MRGEGRERTCWQSRRHGIVLARPLARALGLGLLGFVCFVLGWPLMIAGPPLLGAAAALAGLAVWRWERTKVVLTTEKLFVVHGTLRRRAAAVRLARVGAIEVEQTLLGRLLGYGTLVAGDLEVPYVPGDLVRRLA